MTERFQMKRTDSSCEGMRDVRDGNKQEQMEGRRWVICIFGNKKSKIWLLRKQQKKPRNDCKSCEGMRDVRDGNKQEQTMRDLHFGEKNTKME